MIELRVSEQARKWAFVLSAGHSNSGHRWIWVHLLCGAAVEICSPHTPCGPWLQQMKWYPREGCKLNNTLVMDEGRGQFQPSRTGWWVWNAAVPMYTWLRSPWLSLVTADYVPKR